LLNNPEDFYKIKIDNFENFQDILKNKTLNDLERLTDKPIDLPLVKHKGNIKTEQKHNSDKSLKKEDRKETNEIITTHHKINDILKEKNSLLSDINKKENFRFLNKLSDSNHFDWLKFRQHNFEKDLIENKTNPSDNAKFNNNTSINNNKKSEIQHAMENKIKNDYSHNKIYLEKLNKSLTGINENILGIAKYEKEFGGHASASVKNQNSSSLIQTKNIDNKDKNQIGSNNNNKGLLTTFIQNVKANMGTNLKEIANKYFKKKAESSIDLKGIIIKFQIYLTNNLFNSNF
jgi:hypothetical protein